jgi:hypothetical protein
VKKEKCCGRNQVIEMNTIKGRHLINGNETLREGTNIRFVKGNNFTYFTISVELKLP